MSFDEKSWKDKLRKRLGGWKQRMHAAGVKSVYAFLSAATVWPIVEAVKAGDWTGLTALGGVLASVGSGLLANRIQGWKDEADAARALEAQVAKDPALRATLDEVLEKLNALGQARAALKEADRGWFEKTLRDELKGLGNLDRFQAHLQGSGAIAQGGSVAAGPRAVAAGGDMVNNVIISGDRNTYYGSVASLTIQSVVFKAPPDPERVDPRQLLWTYLNQVVWDTATLDLSGVDRKTASDKEDAQLELTAVYTDLDTLRGMAPQANKARFGHKQGEEPPEERQRQSVVAFVDEQPYAALLGDPGSGKTTFANFLALCLAGGGAGAGECEPLSTGESLEEGTAASYESRVAQLRGSDG